MEKRYENLDGVRTICCLAIIVMHVAANTSYEALEGYSGRVIIHSWTQFVYLFLMISGFGMCCGYYEIFKTGKIDLAKFYARRYMKIVPFFSVLILIDLIINWSKEALYEGIIEIALMHGLLPNNQLDVIGVSWTLGVIFLFYMLFPFVVFLLHNRKSAWLSFAISLLITWTCGDYFFTEKFVIEGFSYRHAFIYCAPFFLLGGVIYLYRDDIEKLVKRFRLIILFVCVVLTVFYYTVPDMINGRDVVVFKLLVLFGLWLSWFISCRTVVLDNRLMHFLGGMSLELYLAQMVAFRAVEKLGFIYIFGTGWVSYIFACIVVMVVLVFFVILVKRTIKFAKAKIEGIRGMFINRF